MGDSPKIESTTIHEVVFLKKVVDERRRQEQLGYDDAHDDLHTYTDFLSFIRNEVYSILQVVGTRAELDAAIKVPENLAAFERRMVRTATLAMAAANAMQRKVAKP